MKNYRILAILSSSALLFICTNTCAEPQNIGATPMSTLRFGPYSIDASKEKCEKAADLLKHVATEKLFFKTTCIQDGKTDFWGEGYYILQTQAFIAQ